jgi:hypothetical protein
MSEREKLMAEALRAIFELAWKCRSDMQGRLVDDEHRRAFDVLASIYFKADSALNMVRPK